MKILIVEDDRILGDGILVGLSQAGFVSEWVKDGETAKTAVLSESIDLLVLDVGLPKLNGFELLKYIRSQKINLPVIILTARDNLADKIQGLDLGADDYLVKPIDIDELAARIRAQLRRSANQNLSDWQFGKIILSAQKREIFYDGIKIELSKREFNLLQTLMQKPGQVYTRIQIESAIYHWGEELESNAVEVHVHNLRKKIGSDVIKTIRGIGYCLVEK